MNIFLLSKESGSLRSDVKFSFKNFLGIRPNFERVFVDNYLVFYATGFQKLFEPKSEVLSNIEMLRESISVIEEALNMRGSEVPVHRWNLGPGSRTQTGYCYIQENLILAFRKNYVNPRKINDEVICVANELLIEFAFLLKYLKFRLIQ